MSESGTDTGSQHDHAGGLPEDYGLDPISTLARVADPTPAPEHSVFWTHWRKAVNAERPSLVERVPDGADAAELDASDRTATHAFISYSNIRIGARLLTPPPGTKLRAGLVSGHGYHASRPLDERDNLFSSCLERGVAVLNVRVRGFPGSQIDTGDLTKPPGDRLGWITRGLDHEGELPQDTMEWVYPQAIADIYNACRALRWWLQDRMALEDEVRPPIYLHGESFTGGLAVGAASLLVGREFEKTMLDRLVLALPTMGDWPWRLFTSGRQSGSGAEILHLLETRREVAGLIKTRLRLCDSVVLAHRVRCPVLCKLAQRDEVVPAPTAAAVFNALGVDPGMKWRFVVPHGHAETGIANARRHAEFDRVAADFLDPGKPPSQAINDWERGYEVERAETTGSTTASLFGADGAGGERVLVEAYELAGRTLDDLPYTDAFEALFDQVGDSTGLDRAGVFRKLHNMRKAGKLPKMGRAEGKAVKVEPEEESALRRMVIETAGSLGQRDRLLYTAEFDGLVERFNAEHGRSLVHHDLWRLIARLAK